MTSDGRLPVILAGELFKTFLQGTKSEVREVLFLS